MANKYYRASLTIALIFVSTVSLAQGPPPPPPPFPIDGGILGLLALGVGYAVKKIHDNSKR
ncbi:MAG: hypothetical protein GY908_13330 [Flavobacteriales bacterium]|nr:hypothetical protein [Flavobacteriales bacterium]